MLSLSFMHWFPFLRHYYITISHCILILSLPCVPLGFFKCLKSWTILALIFPEKLFSVSQKDNCTKYFYSSLKICSHLVKCFIFVTLFFWFVCFIWQLNLLQKYHLTLLLYLYYFVLFGLAETVVHI